ncbi:MAG: hypothetical protein KBD01_09170 [Acidobacteria bacterium]|nr:hypothetical protein [Acidobacteriota bacterium]
MDRVSGQVSWRPARALPTVHLRGEAYTIEGALAANLPGDTVVVPLVQDGQGRGVLAELVLELDSTGTWVEVNWSRMVDEGEQRAILDGAEAWSRRGVSVRQRLASRDRVGATCHIVLAYDASELEQQPAAPPVARLALLERRRVSGGVALSF